MTNEIIAGRKYKIARQHRRYFNKEVIKILRIEGEHIISDDQNQKFHIRSLIAKNLIPYKKKIG